ncbi:MAG TPA: glutamine--fructose-6-phosphate transaminase (isomerizing) [Lentisphaeria bacterium]|nr:MAG: glutamine--fructose-6-phosphate aminotransferase [Lentisphaerae bacterium GWF2_49_21]HBC89173.1 glutamine--fructose-6-phosphate transaminase (isomerizing) [Lentisphaeria bacterium]
MCGIVGYIGNRNIADTLIDGLKRLEYRGYDSAGIAVIVKKKIISIKAVGKVSALSAKITPAIRKELSSSKFGIAHTRWATHGAPSERNAHPHLDEKGRFAVVHNGIIENYASLKERLISQGHKFVSETDTEVLAHLIDDCYEGDLLQAVAAALKKVEGTFGIAVISSENPGQIITARRGSPIVIGIGTGETIVASDISAIVSYTDKVIYLNDNDIALVEKDNVDLRNIDNVPVTREIAHINWDPGAAEKGGYEHFMLKEIFEQPEAIANSIRGRLDEEQGTGALSGLNLTPQDLATINRIIIAACGTSLHAGMVGEYYFEDLADIPTEVEQAAEFRYRNPIIHPGTMIIAISQSGETADTLAAVREAKNKGAIVAGICNVVGSTIPRETGRGIYLHAGPEIGVASTKAFTCQVATLLMMALKFGRARRLSRQNGIELVADIHRIPELVKKVLAKSKDIAKIAKKYANAHDFFFIGRGYLYPVAIEGALKLKEISYVHAEGYHAAELKHGPIALLDEKVPVLALANNIPGKDKIIGNMQECKARKAPVIALATEGDNEIRRHAEDIIWIPECSSETAPIPSVVALQLLAYYIAKERGCPIDQPRNLAKSVTVE